MARNPAKSSEKPYICRTSLPSPDGREVYLSILGEPASKSNQRRFIPGAIPRFIKSAKALHYTDSFISQARLQSKSSPLEGSLKLSADIYYASHRPDLDESLIMDALQKAEIINNDRQIVWKDIRRFIDRANPRSRIIIKEIEWDFDKPILER